jgi:hypothetical protein
LKKISLIVAAIGMVAGANAQGVIYNGLGGHTDDGYISLDGGAGVVGANYGSQIGQVVTDSNGSTSVTQLESYFVGAYTATSESTAMFAEVFNYSGGNVGSLVSSQTSTSFTETDGTFTSSNLNGYYKFDITANFSGLTGLSNGHQYLVVLQAQSPSFFWEGVSYGNNADVWVRDYSNFGYPGLWGTTTWTTAGNIGLNNADQLMKVTGGGSTPEPASICALGLGIAAVIRRRRA